MTIDQANEGIRAMGRDKLAALVVNTQPKQAATATNKPAHDKQPANKAKVSKTRKPLPEKTAKKRPDVALTKRLRRVGK
jgi:hypothetical protein